jgi:hypothetical protein
MACANRAEIVRKATLNCSSNHFDASRSFVFHILSKLLGLVIFVDLQSSLAALVQPIRMRNDSLLLFATFTSDK